MDHLKSLAIGFIAVFIVLFVLIGILWLANYCIEALALIGVIVCSFALGEVIRGR